MKLYLSSALFFLVFFLLSAMESLPRVSVPYTPVPIVINGNADDAAWKNAASIELRQNAEGTQPNPIWKELPTKILLTYDKNYLYLAMFCKDSAVRPVGKKHDDELHRGDAMEIFIDGIGDHRQYFEIQLNALNLVRDVNYLFTGGSAALDSSGMFRDMRNQWDDPCFNIQGLQLKSSILRSGDGKFSGWLLEAALPAKVLFRRSGKTQFAPGMELRANFVRLKRGDSDEFLSRFWSSTVLGRPHRSPGRMGFLILAPETKSVR